MVIEVTPNTHRGHLREPRTPTGSANDRPAEAWQPPPASQRGTPDETLVTLCHRRSGAYQRCCVDAARSGSLRSPSIRLWITFRTSDFSCSGSSALAMLMAASSSAPIMTVARGRVG